MRSATASAWHAAGNGGRNLDSPLYAGRFDRNQFNSRAIIVGAGDGANARRSSSNYGSPVDVQAHGTAVTTTGYGDLFGSTLNDRYTAAFGGTSSASAIVAAAATVLQGYRKHRARPVLTSLGMAGLLKTTGSPQTVTTSQQIGPKPNLRAAIASYNIAVPGLAASCKPYIGGDLGGGQPSVIVNVTQNAPGTTLTLERRSIGSNKWTTIKTWPNAAAGPYPYNTGFISGEFRARASDALSASNWSPTITKLCLET